MGRKEVGLVEKVDGGKGKGRGGTEGRGDGMRERGGWERMGGGKGWWGAERMEGEGRDGGGREGMVGRFELYPYNVH